MKTLSADQMEALRAAVRTLKLLEGYVSTQKPGLLLAWNGGLMTWGELSHHAAETRRHLVVNFGEHIPGLSLESL